MDYYRVYPERARKRLIDLCYYGVEKDDPIKSLYVCSESDPRYPDMIQVGWISKSITFHNFNEDILEQPSSFVIDKGVDDLDVIEVVLLI